MSDADGYFGEPVAATYDESESAEFEPGVVEAAVDVLAGLAGDGRALELGVGTGRIALPLARRGVLVHGIDMSRAMVARMRAKPGGDAIGVTIGDFATTRVDGTFSVAYLVFNTIMNLTTQGAGGLFRQRRSSPPARRLFRHRGRGPRPAQAAVRPDGGAVPRQPATCGRPNLT
jgi:SAM-dependent methyltransferase